MTDKKREHDLLSSDGDEQQQAPVYKGSVECCIAVCTKLAYYEWHGEYYCGAHSAGYKRTRLHSDPVQKAQQQAEHDRLLECAALALQHGTAQPGQVFIARMRMMKSKPVREGCFTVLPNYRAGSGTQLFWAMPALSPMMLGPVEHGQPGLPPALNLENFHQFNKVFRSEVDENGDPLPVFYERRLRGYTDPVPHRHKLGASKAEHMRAAGMEKGGNANVCVYSIFVNPATQQEERYDYALARVFYCTFYERLARETPEYKLLAQQRRGGANLLIAGYDGFDCDSAITAEDVRAWYADLNYPFGHEKVLVAMLLGVRPWSELRLPFDF